VVPGDGLILSQPLFAPQIAWTGRINRHRPAGSEHGAGLQFARGAAIGELSTLVPLMNGRRYSRGWAAGALIREHPQCYGARGGRRKALSTKDYDVIDFDAVGNTLRDCDIPRETIKPESHAIMTCIDRLDFSKRLRHRQASGSR